MLFLYFLKRKFFLYFRKCNPTLFSLRLKNKKKNPPQENFLDFRKQKHGKNLLYISQNKVALMFWETKTLKRKL